MNTQFLIRLAANFAIASAALAPGILHSGLVYNDTFETYPALNPAPNPLTNGPSGGQWFYVDPTPPAIGANEHRIFDAGTGGSALQSRVWVSNHDNATITNAISLPALPAGASVYHMTLSFLAATETSDASRAATFKYQIGSSGGALQFISGGNLDMTQPLDGLAGRAIAPAGSIGKTDDRRFSVAFTASGITTADKIFLALTRVTNAGAAGAFLAVDDVSLDIAFGPPAVIQQPSSVTLAAGEAATLEGAFTNFPHAYQWFKNGEPLPGAQSPRYSIPFATKPDEGSYVLWATNTEGAASTLAATVTVNDFAAPTLATAAGQFTLEHARVRFSEPVDPESATNAANYALSPGGSIQEAWMIDARTVELRASALAPSAPYTIEVSGVRDLAGNAVAANSTIAFTTPALAISAARYDAGATAPDPASAAGGFWIQTANTNAGMAAGPVLNDAGTGSNAWMITDQNISATSGILDYRMAIDPASDEFARTNGWRLVAICRMSSDFGGGASPLVLYSHPGQPRRYGLLFDLDGNGSLTASLLGAATYTLPGDPGAYHTHMIAYNPQTASAAYYFDGQLVTDSYTGQANAAYDGLVFGVGSSGGSGEMAFNRVQLDVAGGSRPVFTSQPQDSVNGVGQRVTFSVAAAPFVAAWQWLSNNVIIPGAISNSYTTPFVTLGMGGAQYKARAIHPLGDVESQPATLTVTSDIQAPMVAGARGSPLLDRVYIAFSEPVQPQQATNIANYSWGNAGVTNLFATMLDPLTVQLRTSAQESASNYVVLLRNIRDTSNLVISNNTPASFRSPRLVTLARYDAGTTVTRPGGPPDPATAEGGSWLAVLGSDPGLVTNAIIDDLATGLHAWQVSDETTGGAQFIQYNKPFTPEQNAALRANGWVMSIRGRFVEDFGSSYTIMAQHGAASGQRELLWFDRDANGDLVSRMAVGAGGTDAILTSGTIGAWDYHLHQLVFDPAATNASYYFDGRLVGSWPGDSSAAAYPGVQWGSGSSPNLGQMNFNMVEFRMIEPPTPPFVAIRGSGQNVEVLYTGILEASTSLGPQAVWSAVATNAAPPPATFPAPASQQSRFFRARAN